MVLKLGFEKIDGWDNQPCVNSILASITYLATVAIVIGTSLPNISWCRDLIGNNLASWNNLLLICHT
ncbi:hypothetical protein U9M48_034838 [Paspalum notatum var. saurae]|uniref:Uncharacterized protein n=1 Tax=Paspalum notatum var. saurae TaxID=547442 RepID=A0AAQ3X9D1_PASNO